MHENEKHILEKLLKVVAEKDTAFGELQQRYSELEQAYDNLKQARMISLTYEEVDNAKEHITRLVREIDQCIDSLIKK